MNTAEEFWSCVNRGDRKSCWLWQRSRNNTGYGTLVWKGEAVVAHRVAAYLAGMRVTPSTKRRRTDPVCRRSVLHTCDNMLCCNPSHLEVGRYGKNLSDAYARGRRLSRRGESNANAKLTRYQVVRIRRMYATGCIRQVDLAARFGVSQRAISLVIRKETYR